MAEGASPNGLTTKEVLLQVLSQVQGIDKKVDEARDSQIRTETILSEGRFGERLVALETFKNKTEGALSLGKWALGTSGLALVIAVLSVMDRLTK